MITGITGHQHLEDSSAWDWVRREITAILTNAPPPSLGVTSLAVGADQLFAEIVLQLGGTIEAVIPFPDYERTFKTDSDLATYLRLKNAASRVEILKCSVPDQIAFLQAGKRVVDRCELLIAVWDGQPSHGLGGTADVVKYAILTGRKWIHLNPAAQKVSVSRRR
jgi:hypothetical protein